VLANATGLEATSSSIPRSIAALPENAIILLGLLFTIYAGWVGLALIAIAILAMMVGRRNA